VSSAEASENAGDERHGLADAREHGGHVGHRAHHVEYVDLKPHAGGARDLVPDVVPIASALTDALGRPRIGR
jgi:hypothetical protein